ncbi:DnaJ domain-containing protein [Leptolyngbya sp. AN03gr2]|uniref:DnaJ domain-containing protein n=1 Tax=unclassified Leptolyngbya TaxID=2650499 RepID=UPI003D310018
MNSSQNSSSALVLARFEIEQAKVVYQQDSNRWKPFILSEKGIHYLAIIIDVDQVELHHLKAINTVTYGIFCLYPVETLPAWVSHRRADVRFQQAKLFPILDPHHNAETTLPAAIALLDLTLDFTEHELKTSYRTLARKTHPDNAQTGNSKQFLVIRAAYTLLSEELEQRKANCQTELTF